ncbi:MAG: hypothetical protein U1F36_23315 [Planctomycetota bacterium]
MKNLTLAVACVSLMAGVPTSLRAQTGPISPVRFADVEGPNSNTLPLAHAQQLVRFQQIQDDLPIRARLVRALAFRRNAVDASFTPFAVDLDLTMSDPARSSASPSIVFAQNHGTNLVTVVARRTIQFPGTLTPRSRPAPFEYLIPLDAPYRVSVATCWDMRVYSHGATNTEFDAVQSPAGDQNPTSGAHFFGTGCRASGSSQPMVAGGSFSGDWSLGTFSLRFTSQRGPANAPHLVAVGFDNQQWGQLPLPFLLPGSLNAPSGPCFIENDILDTLPGTSNGVGTFVTTLGVTLDPAQNGLRIFSQVIALDAGANSLGVVTSNGGVRQIVAPFARPSIAQISLLGSHGTSGTAATGVGVVTRLVE